MENKFAMSSESFKKLIKLIAGIGNPEKKLSTTYHNAGLLFLEFLKEGENWKNKKNFEYSKDNKYIFIKTKTYMNDSGKAIKEALNFFKLFPENILVIHDDSDILIGEYKFQFGKGPAGHKGVASIIQELKTKNFWRIRIGIKKPTQKAKAGDFVLKKISSNDFQILKNTFIKIKEDLEKI